MSSSNDIPAWTLGQTTFYMNASPATASTFYVDFDPATAPGTFTPWPVFLPRLDDLSQQEAPTRHDDLEEDADFPLRHRADLPTHERDVSAAALALLQAGTEDIQQGRMEH